MTILRMIVVACLALVATPANAGRYVTFSGFGTEIVGTDCLFDPACPNVRSKFSFVAHIDRIADFSGGAAKIDDLGHYYYQYLSGKRINAYFWVPGELDLYLGYGGGSRPSATALVDICGRACFTIDYNLIFRASTSDDRPAFIGLAYQQGLEPLAVPEPAAWLMLLIGFGTMGISVRRHARPRERIGLQLS